MSEYCFDTKTATILDSLLQVVQDLQHRFVKFEQQMEKITVMQSTVNLLAEKVNYVEKHLECAMNRSNEIEGSIENIGHVMHKVVDRCKENILNITSLETAVVQHKDHSEKIDSKLRNMEDDAIELKWRSMKTNLIFTGIQFHPEENTEDKLNSFIKQKLKIDKRVNFVCVHRFGKRGHRGNRPILAKFVSIKDKEIVLKNGYKLKETQFGVKEQFPKEIEQQRKFLYPVAKQARKEKRKVRMVRDKLYIDGDLYKPNTEGVGNENVHDVLSFIQRRNITQQYERSTNEPQLLQLERFPSVQTRFDYQTVKNADDSRSNT